MVLLGAIRATAAAGGLLRLPVLLTLTTPTSTITVWAPVRVATPSTTVYLYVAYYSVSDLLTNNCVWI